MWAEKKRKPPHQWLEGVLGVLGLSLNPHLLDHAKGDKGIYLKKCILKMPVIKFNSFENFL
jgi:hypothetical protein